MRRILTVLAFVLGLFLCGFSALGLLSNLVLIFRGQDGALASGALGMVRSSISMAVGWVIVKSTRRFLGRKESMPDASTLARVHEFYVRHGLAQRPARSLEGNLYANVPDAELDGVVESIQPNAPQARLEALLDAVKSRVEANYLPDGRRAPEVLKRTVAQPAAPGSQCVHHTAQPASVTCARCGSFVCQECAPRWGHCTPCLPKVHGV